MNRGHIQLFEVQGRSWVIIMGAPLLLAERNIGLEARLCLPTDLGWFSKVELLVLC